MGRLAGDGDGAGRPPTAGELTVVELLVTVVVGVGDLDTALGVELGAGVVPDGLLLFRWLAFAFASPGGSPTPLLLFTVSCCCG